VEWREPGAATLGPVPRSFLLFGKFMIRQLLEKEFQSYTELGPKKSQLISCYEL